jgi:hypothetical protein
MNKRKRKEKIVLETTRGKIKQSYRINRYLSIITLNAKALNFLIKKCRLAYFIKTTNPNLWSVREIPPWQRH